jgi:hypothetical protein
MEDAPIEEDPAVAKMPEQCDSGEPLEPRTWVDTYVLTIFKFRYVIVALSWLFIALGAYIGFPAFSE